MRRIHRFGRHTLDRAIEDASQADLSGHSRQAIIVRRLDLALSPVVCVSCRRAFFWNRRNRRAGAGAIGRGLVAPLSLARRIASASYARQDAPTGLRRRCRPVPTPVRRRRAPPRRTTRRTRRVCMSDRPWSSQRGNARARPFVRVRRGRRGRGGSRGGTRDRGHIDALIRLEVACRLALAALPELPTATEEKLRDHVHTLCDLAGVELDQINPGLARSFGSGPAARHG